MNLNNNMVTGWPQETLMGCFIRALWEDIKIRVMAKRLATLTPNFNEIEERINER